MHLRTMLAMTSACALTLTLGCKGDPGETGPQGPAGAQGTDGAQGTQGPAGTAAPTTGTLEGTITDATLNAPLDGVALTVKDVGGATVGTATTDATGHYSLTLPFGVLNLTFSKQYFTAPAPMLVGIIVGQTVTLNATLAEAATGKPTLTLRSSAQGPGYAGTATITATATDPNGDTLTYTWSNGTSPRMGTVTGTGTTGTITFPTMTEAFSYKADPTVDGGTNPGMFLAGCTLEDRFGLVEITPDCRGIMTATVKVSDPRGQSTTASISVNATSVATGLRTVPLNARLYLNSGHANGSSWTLSAKPAGSNAMLSDPAIRTPSFIPDVKGTYTFTEGTHTLTFEAGDWQGVVSGGSGGSFTVDTACTTCHNGTLAPDNFTPWKQTGHANIFIAGINGGSGTSGTGCLDCHSVGYDLGANNSGMDDKMLDANWTFPSTRVPANWGNLVTAAPAVAKLANIQCESCHGPQDSANHMQTTVGSVARPYLSPRISYSAELCGTCHGRTSHHLYSEWATPRADGVGHSNLSAAATVGTRTGSLNSSCGRCHTAQGFTQFVGNLKAGRPGSLANQLADVTPANVEPVTCTACHDPHDVTNPNQLRVYGNTGLLPSGFAGYGMGKGALCLTCHNSRNGAQTGSQTLTYLHEDGEPYNAGDPTGYSAPHQAAQGDVFEGRNAYFMGGLLPMVSRHAAIEDTCVGCHMANNPKTYLSHGAPVAQGHLFRIESGDKGALCAKCHAPGINGEGTQAAVEASLLALSNKMGAAVKAKVNGLAGGQYKVVVWDPATDLYSAAAGLTLDASTNPVVSVGIEEIHGQLGVVLKLTTAVSVQFVDAAGSPSGAPKSLTDLAVQLGSLKDNQATPVALFGLSGNLVRAGWNYFLIEGDHSFGLHNPTFAQTTLNATLAQDLSN